MNSNDWPKSYEQAIEALSQIEDMRGRFVTLRAEGGGANPDAISLVALVDDIPFVTFRRDGSIKILTRGTNSFAAIQRINACLPDGYYVRRRGCGLQLIFRAKGSRRIISSFLASTKFTPSDDPSALEETCEAA